MKKQFFTIMMLAAILAAGLMPAVVCAQPAEEPIESAPQEVSDDPDKTVKEVQPAVAEDVDEPAGTDKPLIQGLDVAAQESKLITKKETETDALQMARIKIGNVLRAILALVGLIFMIMVIYGGIIWMTGGGNEEQVKKGRAYIIQAVIGLALTAMGYALTYYFVVLLKTAI